MNRRADEIRDHMSQIRADLSVDVQGIVENARVMSDWRYYVRTYPLACAAAALAVGYLIVPGRVRIVQPDPETVAELARRRRLVVKSTEPERRGGAINALLGLIAASATKGLTTYLTHEAERYFARQQGAVAEKGGEAAPPSPRPAEPTPIAGEPPVA